MNYWINEIALFNNGCQYSYLRLTGLVVSIVGSIIIKLTNGSEGIPEGSTEGTTEGVKIRRLSVHLK